MEAIKAFPVQREIKHCDSTFYASPFDFYVVCPVCEIKIKARSFSSVPELEDVFDSVFEWLIQPGAQECFEKRQQEIIEDSD